MTDVAYKNVSFSYGEDGPPVLNRIDVDVEAGSLLCVLGKSGSGKSTLLHLLAGLLDPTVGEIEIGGQSVLGTPAHRRHVTLLSQKALLFPFTTVAGNIEFSPRLRRWSRRKRAHRTAELLELVGLSGYEIREPQSLSGGEAQRVALARALASDPKVLLMDEPFSNLDSGIRLELQRAFRTIHDQQQLTTLFVTHQIEEAMAMGDRIAGLVHGVVPTVAEPAVMFENPPTTGLAELVGLSQWLTGTWHGSVLSGRWGSIETSATSPTANTVVSARPERLRVRHIDDTEPSDAAVWLSGRVVDSAYRGAYTEITVELGGGARLVAHQQIERGTGRAHSTAGEEVQIGTERNHWITLQADSGDAEVRVLHA